MSNYSYQKQSMTNRYTSQVPSSKYAKILSMNNQIDNKWWSTCIIRLIHGSSTNCIVKDYYLFANKDITLKDLSPEISGIDAFLEVNGNEIIMYAKGSLQFCAIQIQILWCEAIGYFNFYHMSDFIYDKPIENIIEPSYDESYKENIEYILSNNWESYKAKSINIFKQGSSINIDMIIKNGDISADSTMTIIGSINKYLPEDIIPGIAYIYNGIEWSNCICFIRTNGEIIIQNLNANKQVVIKINYTI